MSDQPSPARKKNTPARTMQRVQQLHLILGTLFAPLIVFFSLSGALQTLGLHEQEKAGGPTPEWIAQIAAVHKNQQLTPEKEAGSKPGKEGDADAPAVPKREAPPSEAEGEKGGAQHGPSPWPLKWFIVLMSLGLTFTTALGVWMSFKYSKNKALVWGLLAVGTLLPLALLWL